mgnify:FL=1|nr:MAG TPA: hypothetical protein [Caudoviricetes sp.]
MNESYTINWNNGLKEDINETLENVKSYADEMSSYTQQDIIIENEKGREVCRRIWYGVKAEEEDREKGIIEFGNFGFYDEWQEI